MECLKIVSLLLNLWKLQHYSFLLVYHLRLQISVESELFENEEVSKLKPVAHDCPDDFTLKALNVFKGTINVIKFLQGAIITIF